MARPIQSLDLTDLMPERGFGASTTKLQSHMCDGSLHNQTEVNYNNIILR